MPYGGNIINCNLIGYIFIILTIHIILLLFLLSEVLEDLMDVKDCC